MKEASIRLTFRPSSITHVLFPLVSSSFSYEMESEPYRSLSVPFTHHSPPSFVLRVVSREERRERTERETDGTNEARAVPSSLRLAGYLPRSLLSSVVTRPVSLRRRPVSGG